MYSVLYVDDERDLLEIGRIFLEQTGDLKVGIETSAQDVLNSPHVTSFDAIVSDYQMPDMNGIEFLKEVRSRYGDIPFILFTGRGREEVVIEAINNGADFYLQKGGAPTAQFAELAHKIKNAIERHRAMRDLRASERRLSDIINFLPDATFAIDKNGYVIAWNRAMEEITGTPASAVIGRSDYCYASAFYREARPMLIDLVLRGDPQFEKDHYLVTTRDETTLTAETEVERPGDGITHYWGKASCLYDEKGNLAGSIESIRDITDRKRVEEALRESDEKYRLAAGMTGQLVYEYDMSLDRIRWSGSVEQITGYTPTEFPVVDKTTLLCQIHPEDREGIRSDIENIDPHAEKYHVEFRFRRKDGSYLPMENTGGFIRDPSGKRIRMIGTQKDLSLKKQAELELKRSEAKFRGMAERISDIILLVDKNFQMMYASPSFQALIGIDPRELLGKPLPIGAMKEQDQEIIREAFSRNLAGEVTGPVPVTMMTRRGKEITLELHGVPILEEGIFSGVQVVAHDITDLKKAQDELRAAYEQLTASEEELRTQYGDLAKGEQKIRESEGQFRAVFDNSPYAITINRAQDRTFLAVNPAFERNTGYSASEVLEKDSVSLGLFPPEANEEIALELKNFDRVDRKAVTITTCDGTTRSDLLSAVRVVINNQPAILTMAVDITEQKAAEDELRRERAFMNAVIDSVPGLLYLYDEEGHLVRWSRSHETLTGYSAEELSGMHVLDWYKGDDDAIEVIKESVARAFREGHAEAEANLTMKGGEKIPFYFTAKLLEIEGKKYFTGVGIDITNLKKVEDALRTSEKRLELALDAAGSGLFDWNMVNGTAYFSPRYYTMLGYEPDELPASFETWISLLHPDDCERMKSIIEEYWKSGRDHHSDEFRLKAKNGEWRWVLSKGRITGRDTWGRPTRMVGTHTDISERKKIEEELLESEGRYRGVIENIVDAFVRTGPGGRLIMASPSTAKLFGCGSVQEMIGMDVSSIYRFPEKRSKMLETLQNERNIHDYPIELLRRDGSPFWGAISAHLYYESKDSIPGVEGIIRDITDRKNLESAIREANRKLNLLSNVTRHDIMNQLSVLQGYAQLAALADPDPVIADFLKKIRGSADIISRQIEFTRTYQDLGNHEPSWFRVKDAISRVKNGIVDLADSCDETEICTDPMLERVFFNLFENAVRHGEHVTKISISFHESPDGFRITVQDDGIGIPAELKEKIFEKGYGKNTGFGLFLAREILAITGISLRETGEYGKGAQFEILVPRGRYRTAGTGSE
ncbi:MAG: PAS domain S-box protein [Methanoregulaceae archaeon]